jgi:hypothetical protein
MFSLKVAGGHIILDCASLRLLPTVFPFDICCSLVRKALIEKVFSTVFTTVSLRKGSKSTPFDIGVICH